MVEGREVVFGQHSVLQDYTCCHMQESLEVCCLCPLCYEPVTEATEGVCKIPEVTLTCKGTVQVKAGTKVRTFDGFGGLLIFEC